jgi:hypothetical protein
MNDPRWQRINQMDLDKAGAVLSFTRRLARENGWSVAYARRVVAEYKRFLFLTVCQSSPVTPSDDVDQAWHLHLQYSQHYWDVLCDEVLGAKLHHGPTEGGSAETSKYKGLYEQTLALYRETFGEKPPGDIWPSVSERFAYVNDFRRVNTSKHYVIPKLTSRPVVIGAAALLLAGCAAIFEDGTYALGGLALIVLVVFLWKVIKAGINGKWFGGCSGGGCGGCGGCS